MVHASKSYSPKPPVPQTSTSFELVTATGRNRASPRDPPDRTISARHLDHEQEPQIPAPTPITQETTITPATENTSAAPNETSAKSDLPLTQQEKDSSVTTEKKPELHTVISMPQQEDPHHPWWVAWWDEGDGFYSVGLLLFVFGFVCPPLWWIGAFWPRHAGKRGGKMAERWQKLNIALSIGFSGILVIGIIIFAVLYSIK